MESYFDSSLSAQKAFGTSIPSVIQTVANRYVAENPVQPFVFRLSSHKGIMRDAHFQYQFDLDRIYPNTENEKVVYAWAKMWSDTDHLESFKAAPNSPMEVYVNGNQVYRSNFYEEKTHKVEGRLKADFVCGWNSIVLLFTKTSLGFGGAFGTPFFKNKPWHFCAPTPERSGQEGFIFTEPTDRLTELPQLSQKESDTLLKWHPACDWSESEKKAGQFKRIFGTNKDSFAYGWTKVLLQSGQKYKINGSCTGALSVFINGQKAVQTETSGKLDAEFSAPDDWADVVVEGKCTENDNWGFQISIVQNNIKSDFVSPCSLHAWSGV